MYVCSAFNEGWMHLSAMIYGRFVLLLLLLETNPWRCLPCGLQRCLLAADALSKCITCAGWALAPLSLPGRRMCITYSIIIITLAGT
jgi:hypothetical protein